MNKKKKPIRVNFFGEEIISPEPQTYRSAFAILAAIDGGQIPLTAVNLGGHFYELRELVRVGSAYQGVIGMFRQDDLPRIGKIGTQLDPTKEHDIPMQDDEGLIEKTHFVLYKRPPLLLMQLNRQGPGVNTLARYLSGISKEKVSFPPVLRREAYERMLSNDMHAREVSIKIARPQGVDVLKKEVEKEKGVGFLKELLHLMNDNRAAKLSLTLQANMETKASVRTLSGNIKKGVAAVFNNYADTEMLETAKLKMENEHGEVHLVDLIEDRLFAKISVEMEDRYPNKTSMFREMIRAKDAARDDLRGFFPIG